ncbi:hypothetical protein [Enterococcus sp. AZ126]|uniref:hypothetical protein n=1 Tax=Enterococcus sp. AZ126 TaxID=2774635 RepID=UPI003F687AB8
MGFAFSVNKNHGQEKRIKEMTKDKRLREYNFGIDEDLPDGRLKNASVSKISYDDGK